METYVPIDYLISDDHVSFVTGEWLRFEQDAADIQQGLSLYSAQSRGKLSVDELLKQEIDLREQYEQEQIHKSYLGLMSLALNQWENYKIRAWNSEPTNCDQTCVRSCFEDNLRFDIPTILSQCVDPRCICDVQSVALMSQIEESDFDHFNMAMSTERAIKEAK